MAFPTTSVLDSGAGSDQDPLGAPNWTSPSMTGREQCRRVSNQFAGPVGDQGYSYWSAATYGPDTEVFATVSTLPGSGSTVSLYGRVQDPDSGSEDWYQIDYNDGGGWSFYAVRGGGYNFLTSAGTPALSAGDKIGLEITGTGATVTVTAYRYNSGAWASVLTFGDTDSGRIVSAGYVGIQIVESTCRLVDFGGGTVGVPTPSIRATYGTFPKTKLRRV